MVLKGNNNDIFKIEEETSGVSTCLVNIDNFAAQYISGIDIYKFRFAKSKHFNDSNLKLKLFSQEEFEQINRFRTLKRQIEWMCGRFAVKQLVCKEESFQIEHINVQVSNHPKGAPYLKTFPNFHITISHSNSYAIAGLSTKDSVTVSVDIEKVEKREMKYLLHVGFTERERKFLNPNDYKTILKNWTIKEAFLKHIKEGFHESLGKVEIIKNNLYYNHLPVNNLKIKTKEMKNYVITLCYG